MPKASVPDLLLLAILHLSRKLDAYYSLTALHRCTQWGRMLQQVKQLTGMIMHTTIAQETWYSDLDAMLLSHCFALPNMHTMGECVSASISNRCDSSTVLFVTTSTYNSIHVDVLCYWLCVWIRTFYPYVLLSLPDTDYY
jgi:hypothetical protein